MYAPKGIDESIESFCKKADVFKSFQVKVPEIYFRNDDLCHLIIEDFSEFEDDAIDADNLDLEDTMTLLDDYIDNIHTDLDTDRLKNVVKTLYVEARNL